MQNDNVFSYVEEDVAVKNFMAGVYGWMAVGVLISGIVAFVTATTPALANLVERGFIFFIIAEFAMVIMFGRKVMTMKYSSGALLFILFSALNGLTLFYIFWLYELGSVAGVFFITAGMFGVTSAWGFFTKKNLSGWSNILFMGIIGLIIASIVNIFLKSMMMYYLISYIGIAVFVALTAYKTQSIKQAYHSINASGEVEKRLSLLGAFSLYITFINLFLFLLRIFGRRK